MLPRQGRGSNDFPSGHYRLSLPARSACQTRPVVVSSAVNQPPRWHRLLIHRQLGHKARVRKEVRRHLMIRSAAAQELAMLIGHPFCQGASGAARHPARGAEGPRAAAGKPLPQRNDVTEGVEQHLLVIAEKRDQPPTSGQLDELFQDAAAIGAPVDAVAECDKRFFRARANGIDESDPCLPAAVNVADRYGASRHAGSSTRSRGTGHSETRCRGPSSQTRG
jgi:hypothetical protein